MKLAIVGTGMIVKEVLPVLQSIEGISLKYLIATTRSLSQAEQLATKYNIAHFTDDYHQALNSDEVDTLYIALPNHLHYEYAKQALIAHKNVICEKPFTLTYEQLNQLIQLAEQQDCFLLEAITNLHLPNFQLIKQQLGNLGDLKIVQCNYSQYSSRYEAFKRGEILPVFDVKQGGGALRDLNIYNIHLVVGLFGEPISVQYLANIEQNVDTSGILIMDYGRFKAVCIGAKDSTAPVLSIFQGDKGSLVIDGSTNSLPQLSLQLANQPHQLFDQNGNHHRMFNEFVTFERIIRTQDKDQAMQLLAHSQKVMHVLEQAVASFRTNS